MNVSLIYFNKFIIASAFLYCNAKLKIIFELLTFFAENDKIMEINFI